MSEYQYYDFRAIDRPLDAEALKALRALSTRARITPTRFVLVVLAEREGRGQETRRRVAALREAHAKKMSLLARFDKAGLA